MFFCRISANTLSFFRRQVIHTGFRIIEVHRFESGQQEAESLAEQIGYWIIDEGLPPSEIAVLVSKQAELYAELLMAALERREIPFRNEQQLQDLSVEPATRLIVDYLLVLFGDREPDAYARLMEQLTASAIDEDVQSKLRNDWLRFIKVEREKVVLSEPVDRSFDKRWSYVVSFLTEFGGDRLVSLSADYESSARLKEVLGDTKERLSELLGTEHDVVQSLALLNDDRAVRIMTIHKSKGLEFDSVIILGVEEEAFWGNEDEERCAYFVGISRAKRRLVLTSANIRPRPVGFAGRWSVSRTPHGEFIGYAEPFCEDVF